MPTVSFTPNLKRFFPRLGKAEVTADSVRDALLEIEIAFPGILDYIVDEQKSLREHVNIFVNNQTITDKINLSDQIKPDDDLYIMQALTGALLTEK
jgi:molybdopterin synthase sulfur carrier subunit